VPQQVSPAVALGQGGFAADDAPADALVAIVNEADGSWVVAESLAAARRMTGKIQGRRTTAEHRWPLEVPNGDWAATLRTTWVEPAYLETDASWCAPGGVPATALGNGGAFGGKVTNPLGPRATSGLDSGLSLDTAAVASRLSEEHQRPVLVLASRELTTAAGAKRPPVAAGIASDGTGVFRAVATPGLAELVARIAPSLRVEEVEVPGPPTSMSIRAAGWAEATILQCGLNQKVGTIRSLEGSEATASIAPDGAIDVSVRCGRILDATVLRSYCIGAAHMAWSWLTSEALTVDEQGIVHDLTVRSFGVLRAVDTPTINVELIESDDEPVNGSDAVFVAVAAAGWINRGCRQDWPVS